jgi:hypothetical protein
VKSSILNLSIHSFVHMTFIHDMNYWSLVWIFSHRLSSFLTHREKCDNLCHIFDIELVHFCSHSICIILDLIFCILNIHGIRNLYKKSQSHCMHFWFDMNFLNWKFILCIFLVITLHKQVEILDYWFDAGPFEDIGGSVWMCDVQKDGSWIGHLVRFWILSLY